MRMIGGCGAEGKEQKISLLSKIHIGFTYWFSLKVALKEAKKKRGRTL